MLSFVDVHEMQMRENVMRMIKSMELEVFELFIFIFSRVSCDQRRHPIYNLDKLNERDKVENGSRQPVLSAAKKLVFEL